MERDVIKIMRFSEIDLEDRFFDSLKEDYDEFNIWYRRKSANPDEEAYILEDENNELVGFMYLKDETEEDITIKPHLPKKRRLKIGTFKIDSRGTILGDRFLSIALRRMVNDGFQESYVTLFPSQESLIRLFTRYGFNQYGVKNTGELVYTKTLADQMDIFQNYPKIKKSQNKKHLLSIYPEFHTELFPESMLATEKYHQVEDLEHTNTIQKTYISSMDRIQEIKPGDLIVIYRTRDENRTAEYSSVATSICTAIDVRHIHDYDSLDDFLEQAGRGSIFSESDLISWYKATYPKYKYVIRMLYNFPLQKRIIRNELINEAGLDRSEYWGCFEMTDKNFDRILEMGEINEGFIIN